MQKVTELIKGYTIFVNKIENGRFNYLRLIDEGSYAVVLKAKDALFKSKCAIKIVCFLLYNLLSTSKVVKKNIILKFNSWRWHLSKVLKVKLIWHLTRITTYFLRYSKTNILWELLRNILYRHSTAWKLNTQYYLRLKKEMLKIRWSSWYSNSTCNLLSLALQV